MLFPSRSFHSKSIRNVGHPPAAKTWHSGSSYSALCEWHQIKTCGCVRRCGLSIISDLKGLELTFFICKPAFCVPADLRGHFCHPWVPWSYVLAFSIIPGHCVLWHSVSSNLCNSSLLPHPLWTSPASLPELRPGSFLKATVGHALKQTGDPSNQALHCETHIYFLWWVPLKLQWPPFSLLWQRPLDLVNLVFTTSQSEHMDSLCVSQRSRAFTVEFSKSDFW